MPVQLKTAQALAEPKFNHRARLNMHHSQALAEPESAFLNDLTAKQTRKDDVLVVVPFIDGTTHYAQAIIISSEPKFSLRTDLHVEALSETILGNVPRIPSGRSQEVSNPVMSNLSRNFDVAERFSVIQRSEFTTGPSIIDLHRDTNFIHISANWQPPLQSNSHGCYTENRTYAQVARIAAARVDVPNCVRPRVKPSTIAQIVGKQVNYTHGLQINIFSGVKKKGELAGTPTSHFRAELRALVQPPKT